MSKKIILTFTLLIISVIFINAQETFKSLNELGNQEINSGNYAWAMEYFDKALKIGTESKSEVVWTALLAATCASQQNLDEQVIEYNNIAIKNGCEEITVIDQQLELAKKYKDRKTFEEVLKYARKIEGSYERYTIKLLYFYYNNQKFDKTVLTADEVLQFNPTHFNASYFKGIALVKTGKEDEAELLFEEMLIDQPEHSKVSLQLGLIYFNRGSAVFDKANKEYNSITKPTRVDYHTYREKIKKSGNNYEKCLPLLEKAYKANQQEYIQQAMALAKGRLRQII